MLSIFKDLKEFETGKRCGQDITTELQAEDFIFRKAEDQLMRILDWIRDYAGLIITVDNNSYKVTIDENWDAKRLIKGKGCIIELHLANNDTWKISYGYYMAIKAVFKLLDEEEKKDIPPF